MAKIVSVGILSEFTLDIQLEHENTILFNLNLLTDRPEYEALLEDDRILYPKTDGECVYWKGGPRLSFEEIMELLQNNNKNKEEIRP